MTPYFTLCKVWCGHNHALLFFPLVIPSSPSPCTFPPPIVLAVNVGILLKWAILKLCHHHQQMKKITKLTAVDFFLKKLGITPQGLIDRPKKIIHSGAH